MKNNYHIECYSRNKKINTGFCPDWFGITEDKIINISIGVSIGLRVKYKHPKIYVFQMHDDKKVLIHIQA